MISIRHKIEEVKFRVYDYDIPVNTDFRNVIEALENTNDVEKYISILSPPFFDILSVCIYDYNLSTKDSEKIIVDFLKHINSEIFDIDDFKDDKKQPQILDFDVDSSPIISSFKQAYNIDLMFTDFDYRVFIAYLINLTNTKMNDIWHIRTVELPTGKGSSKERKELIELKEHFAIKKNNQNENDNISIAKKLRDKWGE